jgi:tetratricopeptide (TPR) repeat protein
MAIVERTVIWRTAWGLVPVALVLNLWLGYETESEMRFQKQAYANAGANRWDEAAALYERAAQAVPSSAVAAYNTAAAYQMGGDLEHALEWNARALELDPAMELALQQRAKLEQHRRARAGRGSGAPTP